MRKRNKEASEAEKPLFDDLKRSLLEAGTIARGEAKPARHFKAEIPDTHRSDETEQPKSNSTGKRDRDGGEEFTAAERNLIRIAFRDQRWGGTRSIDEGLFLYRWVGGPKKGQPKLNKHVQSLLERGLIEIVEPERGFPFARFTPAGFSALKNMARNKNMLRPDRYQYLRHELWAKEKGGMDDQD